MAQIVIGQIESAAEIDAARDLVREFTAYALKLDPDAEDSHAFAGVQEQLAALPGMYAPPEGAFLLAQVDGKPAGCVAFFRHDASVCEVKRLYVRPAYRGLQLGDQLVRALIERAQAQGYRKMVLDTYYKLDAAKALYERLGFRIVPPTIDLPPHYDGKVIFMERNLTS